MTVVTYTNTPSEVPTPVASGLSQRIIFHNDTNQVVRLLSEVFQLRRPDVMGKDSDGYNVVSTQGVPVLVTPEGVREVEGLRFATNPKKL